MAGENVNSLTYDVHRQWYHPLSGSVKANRAPRCGGDEAPRRIGGGLVRAGGRG